MKKKDNLNGYKVVREGEILYIDEFPNFPNQNKKSKEVFQAVERIILNEKFIFFPTKFNITERVVLYAIGTEDYFSISGIKNLIDRDKLLFIDTKTFFKIKISFIDSIMELKIIYYTIDDDKGLIYCDSFENLLEIICIKYNTKQFTPKRVEFLTNVANLKMNELKQIPIIPVQWLNFDKNGNLLDFPNIKIIED
jgi:hypothetical protein